MRSRQNLHQVMQRRQRAWDSVPADKMRSSLLSTTNQLGRARLLAAETAENGAWLHALPSASLGTLSDPSTLKGTVPSLH